MCLWRCECGLRILRSRRTHGPLCSPETRPPSLVFALEPTGWQERCWQCTGLQPSGLKSRNHLQGRQWTCPSCLLTAWPLRGSTRSSPRPPPPSSTSRCWSFLWPVRSPHGRTAWGYLVPPEACSCVSPVFCRPRQTGRGGRSLHSDWHPLRKREERKVKNGSNNMDIFSTKGL